MIFQGLAVAVSMDATLKWNVDGNPKAYADLAHAFGVPLKGQAIASVFRDLLHQTRLDKSLGGKQIDPKALADMMLAEENRPMVENNARPITTDDAVIFAKQTVSRFQ